MPHRPTPWVAHAYTPQSVYDLLRDIGLSHAPIHKHLADPYSRLMSLDIFAPDYDLSEYFYSQSAGCPRLLYPSGCSILSARTLCDVYVQKHPSTYQSFSVVVDSFYFGFLHLDRAVAPTFEEFMLLPLARMLQLRPQGKLVSTLWNLVVYNTDKEHLKIHGIHPRWLHICVNMPLLFGPLLVPLIISIKGLLIGSERRSLLNMTNVCTLVGGLSLLSAVPHQEPRFLVPILTPLILLAVPVIHKMTPGQSKFFWSVWILFNVMMTIGLGVVHQGGVIPSLLYLDHHELGVVTGCVPTSTDATSLQCDIGPNQGLEQGTDSHRQFQTRIIYRKLFTPPKHLLGLRNRTVTDHHDIDFIHIAGHPASAIPYFAESMSLPVLDSVSQKRHAKTAHFALNSDGVYQRMLLVTPIYTLHDITPVLSAEDLTLVERWRWPLHFNFDDIGLIGAELAKGHFEALAVGVYEVVNTHQG
ncbi:Alg9-like mannosyltransferase family-domain-containing protein [Phlyctochytrium arcticum]|nr:Alg9-like mannosyltransferase family-domain-containing protein [Phlyctochytrium arcticum]